MTAGHASVTAEEQTAVSTSSAALTAPAAAALQHRNHGAEPASSDDDREATELRSYAAEQTRTRFRSAPHANTYGTFGRLWRHHIALAVPHHDCRDHLANERTFLAYLRTAAAISMIGVTIAQLFRLELDPDPEVKFGYYDLGKPLGAAFQAVAITVTLVACHRFMRQQKTMTRGRVFGSGWELYVLWVLVGLLTVAAFVSVLGAEALGKA